MTRKLGDRGEAAVVAYLERQGFTILACNYQKFYGEIDIIARNGNLLSFVEVKTRKNPIVSMHELVTPAKQRKIILVAKTFISATRGLPEEMIYRFDVALVNAKEDTCSITYIPNAFSMSQH